MWGNILSNSKYTYEKYVMEEFEFDYGRVLNNVQVEYSTRELQNMMMKAILLMLSYFAIGLPAIVHL